MYPALNAHMPLYKFYYFSDLPYVRTQNDNASYDIVCVGPSSIIFLVIITLLCGGQTKSDGQPLSLILMLSVDIVDKSTGEQDNGLHLQWGLRISCLHL